MLRVTSKIVWSLGYYHYNLPVPAFFTFGGPVCYSRGMRHSCIALIALLGLVACGARAQDTPVPQLSDLIRANETFGRRLLAELHAGDSEKNVIVSPLGVSISFAPIRFASNDTATLREIDGVFGWERIGHIDLSSKMLLARFDEDGTRMSTQFIFRKDAGVSTDFLKTIRRYFGVEFRAVGPTEPQEHILSQGQGPSFVPPKVEGERINNFWVENRTDLDTVWSGNTFAMGRRRADLFTLESGTGVQTPMLVSELSNYQHVKTPDFEATRLNCVNAYILVVLPSAGKDLRDFERTLSDGQTLVNGNSPKEIGDVELPEFHLKYDANLRPALEKMGMNRIFTNMGSLRRLSAQGAMLLGVSQKVDMKLDKEGIHAHAFTYGGGIAGGVFGGAMPTPFHMVVNRPFLFFIYDTFTDSLLFAGAVVDPSKN